MLDDYLAIALLLYSSLFVAETLIGRNITRKTLLRSILVTLIGLFLMYLTYFIPSKYIFGMIGNHFIACWLLVSLWLEDRDISLEFLLYTVLTANFAGPFLSNMLKWVLPFEGTTAWLDCLLGTGLTILCCRIGFFDLLRTDRLAAGIRRSLTAVFFLLYCFVYNGDLNYSIFLAILLVLLGLSLSYKLGAYLQEKRSKREIIQNLLLYTDELETLSNDLAAFKHDYINILLNMETSIKEQDLPQIKKIFYDTVYPAGDAIRVEKSSLQKYAGIRVPQLRNLLIAKEFQGKKVGVSFQVETIGKVEALTEHLQEFTRGISLLLDEAIQAARSSNHIVELSLIHIASDTNFSCRFHDKTPQADEVAKHPHKRSRGTRLKNYSLEKVLDQTPNMTLTTETSADERIETLTLRSKNLEREEGTEA